MDPDHVALIDILWLSDFFAELNTLGMKGKYLARKRKRLM